MRKISKVRRIIMVLGIAALFSITNCGGVAFGLTEYYFSLGPSPGRAGDSKQARKDSRSDADVDVQRYIDQTNGIHMYIRVRMGTNNAGPCTEKKPVITTARYSFPYYCYDINEMYYLRGMTDDIATTGYAAMTGMWIP